MNGFGIGLAEFDVGVWDSSDGNENISFDFFGKAFGGEIFVNYGVDSFEAF